MECRFLWTIFTRIHVLEEGTNILKTSVIYEMTFKPEKVSVISTFHYRFYLLVYSDYNKRPDKFTILTKMAIKVGESCCLCYIKRKKKTNETTRILISFKREALLAA